MALTATNLTSGAAATSGGSTASITPGANKLILLTVSFRNGSSTNPTTPTISGNGLTWVLITSIVFDTSGTSRRTVFLFRAMGASPTTGAITITAAETETDTAWSVDEITGMDTTGTNGSGAIVQSATNKDETLTATSLTVTLAAFASTNNATFGAFASTGGFARTAGTGFTKLGDAATGVAATSEFEATNNTSVVMNYSGASNDQFGGIAIEIKAATTSTTKTQTGISRITQVTPKTQTGKANAVWDKTTQYDHVVFIIMENTNYTNIIGNTTDAPYINNTLLPLSASMTNYFALDHPSLGNYLALISGSTQGQDNGTDPNVGPPDHLTLLAGTNLIDRLENASISWKAYMEAMPSDWYTRSSRTMGDTGGNDFASNPKYQEHHNPFVYFNSNNDTNANSRLTKIVPYTQLATDLAVAGGTGLPKFVWITPEMDHDMHDALDGSTNAIKAGDNFLSALIPSILTSDAFTKQKSLLILTWDEDENNGSGNKVACIITGYNVRQNVTSSNRYDHYTTLKTIETALGHLTPIQTSGAANNDLTATIFSDIFLTSKDQTGKARIALITSKLQTAKSRITAVVAKTQSAVANIKNNTLRLQTAVARIQRTSGAIIDQQQIADTSFDFIIGWTSEQKDAQSFQPGFTGYLTKVNVNLEKVGAPTDNVQMQIYSDNAGVPGSLLFSADSVVAAASISGSYGSFTFTFSTGQALVSGTSYWIVLSRTGSLDNTNYYLVNGADSHSDQYTRGVNRFFDGSGWQDPDVGNFCDISFQEYYQPTITRGIASIIKLATRTTTGIARITDITQKLQTAKSRITQTTSKTITGLSRITVTTSRTIAGVGRITQTALKTITGKARITQVTLQTQTGVAHINAPGITTTTQMQPGKARITATTLRLQLAKARVTISTSQIMAAVARLIYTTTRTITGKANISASTQRQKTITGVANIQNSLIQSTGWRAVTIPSTVWTKP